MRITHIRVDQNSHVLPDVVYPSVCVALNPRCCEFMLSWQVLLAGGTKHTFLLTLRGG